MIPNTFINVLTGVGARVASQDITGKNYQAIMLVNASGNFVSDAIINSIAFSSFRISGNATTGQNLLTLTSNYNLGKIFVNAVGIISDYTAAQTTMSAQARLQKMTVISGGYSLTNYNYLDANSQNFTGFIIRNRTNQDNQGFQQEISGILGNIYSQKQIGRVHTAVGIIDNYSVDLWPISPAQYRPIILNSGESVCVNIATQTTASNPITNTYIVNLLFDIV